MKAKLKIHKTKITKRSDPLAQAIVEVLKKSKKLKKPDNKKAEGVLFRTLMAERQSMKKAHAFRNWKKFVNEKFAEEKA